MLQDATLDVEAIDILKASVGKARVHGYAASPHDVPAGYSLLISSRNWPSLVEQAVRVLGPERMVVMLHLGFDPNGYWDFATSLQGSLAQVLKDKVSTSGNLDLVSVQPDFWMSARSTGGRISAGAHHLMRHYPDVLEKNATNLVAILGRLSDQKSRDAFTRILFGNPEQVLNGYLGDVFGPQQYMDVVKLRPGDTVINAGVGAGWEVPYFIAQMKGEGRIHSFDPVFQIAGHWAEPTWTAFGSMLTNHEIALLDTDRSLRMASQVSGMVYGGGGEDIDAAAASGMVVKEFQGRALDSLVADGTVTACDYIKMDIEGGEVVALRGMVDTLKRFRPKLSIAIYHEPEHFFEIPMFLIENTEDYRFYIRQYSTGRFETLLYAVPNEDAYSRSGEEFAFDDPATPAEKDKPIRVLSYLQDKTERLTHHGKPVRQLDRFLGGHWEFASLEPALRIDGLSAISLTELALEDRTVLVAKAAGKDDRDEIFLGELTEPLSVRWLASRSVKSGAAVPVVGLAVAEACVGEYIASEQALYVYRCALDAMVGAGIVRNVSAKPCAIIPGDGPGEMTLVLERTRRLQFATIENFSVVAIHEAEVPFAFEFLSVCVVDDFGGGLGRRGTGFVLRDLASSAQLVVVRTASGELSPVRDLVTPDFATVCTGVADKERRTQFWPMASGEEVQQLLSDAALRVRADRFPATTPDPLTQYAEWFRKTFL